MVGVLTIVHLSSLIIQVKKKIVLWHPLSSNNTFFTEQKGIESDIVKTDKMSEKQKLEPEVSSSYLRTNGKRMQKRKKD